ncbi:hypothetical protein BDR03DRAFT_107024 [Suillus americanus]|nr:hypothetical protein BDR03DRAFT_107024 [Suillus americanus]
MHSTVESEEQDHDRHAYVPGSLRTRHLVATRIICTTPGDTALWGTTAFPNTSTPLNVQGSQEAYRASKLVSCNISVGVQPIRQLCRPFVSLDVRHTALKIMILTSRDLAWFTFFVQINVAALPSRLSGGRRCPSHISDHYIMPASHDSGLPQLPGLVGLCPIQRDGTRRITNC